MADNCMTDKEGTAKTKTKTETETKTNSNSQKKSEACHFFWP